MVEVNIYPACLKCIDPHFKDMYQETYYYPDYTETVQRLSCIHECVCKLIDGQEPINLDELRYSNKIAKMGN